MQRTIKFRAARGKDIIGEYTLEEIYQSGAQSESDAYWGNDEDKLNLNPDNIYKGKSEEPVVFYQYTGLLDRHGVEIYEGDIVKLKTGAIGFYEYSEPHLAFAVRLKEHDYGGDDFIISKLDGWYNFDVEVIGNIWENPELLK